LLKPKDRANLAVVTNGLAGFGPPFIIVSLLSAALVFSLARCFWTAKLRPAAQRLLLLSIAVAFITRGIVIPEMAQARSYRAFMHEVNDRIGPEATLSLFGNFNSDSIIFYHGEVISPLKAAKKTVASRIGGGGEYLIVTEQTWKELQKLRDDLPAPLLQSEGKGPEGDARLMLVQADLR
jgi:hypothetical protein